jgi:hypothetical protein
MHSVPETYKLPQKQECLFVKKYKHILEAQNASNN